MPRGFAGLEDAISDVEVKVRGRLADVPTIREVQGNDGKFERVHWPLEDVETTTEDLFVKKLEKWSVDFPYDPSAKSIYIEAIYPATKGAGVDLKDAGVLMGLVGKTLTFERRSVERQRVKKVGGKFTYSGTYKRTKREQDALGEWVDVLDAGGEKIKETAVYTGLLLTKVE